MPIDNQLYDRFSHTWWDEDGFLNILKSGLNPARVGYLRRILNEELGLQLDGLRMLDVGCGGGILAEEFASLGCVVSGVDPSADSLQVARDHAQARGLEIDYREARAETLPFATGDFPVVYCCDVLEHVDNVSATIGEITRILSPGGVFLYDTINRTWQSNLVMIKLAQEWSATAWAEPDLHDFAMFIRPHELEAAVRAAGLEVRDRVGFGPANPLAALKAMWDRAHGKLTYSELGERLRVRETRDVSVSYGGFALKPLD